jgi:hypothetical protein
MHPLTLFEDLAAVAGGIFLIGLSAWLTALAGLCLLGALRRPGAGV